MQDLRKMIRQILLENLSAHEQKILDMFASGNADSIVQAIELADAVGIIQVTKRKQLQQGHPNGTFSYDFTCANTSFEAKLCIMAPKLSKGFYRGKSDVRVSCFRGGNISVTVNQR